MKCPDCGFDDFRVSRVGGGTFHCQCKKCGSEFEAKKLAYGEAPVITGPWPYKKWGKNKKGEE